MIALCDWCHEIMHPEVGEMFQVRVTPYAAGAPKAVLEWKPRDICEPCAEKLGGFTTPLVPENTKED